MDGYEQGWIESADGRVRLTCLRARSRRARRLGMRGLEGLQPLLLPGEPCVHMRGVAGSLDLVFLGRTGRVLAIRHACTPGLRLHGCWRARACLELPAGGAAALKIEPGVCLLFRPGN